MVQLNLQFLIRHIQRREKGGGRDRRNGQDISCILQSTAIKSVGFENVLVQGEWPPMDDTFVVNALLEQFKIFNLI